MKIINFVSEKDDLLGLTVQDMMRLFEITEIEEERLKDVYRLRDHCIWIKNRYTLSQETVTIVTEVYYWRETGVLGCSIKRGIAYVNQEDPVPALKRMVRLHLFKILCKITDQTPGPWGILRGVRPTKIIHRFLDSGYSTVDIMAKMQEMYAVKPDKAALITEIAHLQRPFLPLPDEKKTISVYIGIPYCPSRCLYCSFPANVLPKTGNELQLFLAAIEHDIKNVVEFITRYHLQVENVYIGGGTPTSLSDDDFAWLLELVRTSFITEATREFTVEAGRPDSITDTKIAVMEYNKVTRVSVNPQTMQEKTLKQIGRMHSVQDTIDVYRKIKKAVPVVNMDIIAGLPGETIEDMIDTLQQIKELNPDNLTVHTLALKRGSRLKEHLEEYSLPNEQITLEMTKLAGQAAIEMGMHPYYLYRQKYMTGNLENIGYAKLHTESRYNIQIIEERQTIIGIGPAAGTKAVFAGTWKLKNCYNAKDVQTYIHNIDQYINKREKILNEIYAISKEELS